MKILSTEQIRLADQYTIAHEPIASIDLMERAATALFGWIRQRLNPDSKVMIFAGMGNNGGDGLALARLLFEQGHQVAVYLVRYTQQMSPDCAGNLARLQEYTQVETHEILGENDFPEIGNDSIVVDAIFGSGLNKAVSGFTASLIRWINDADPLVIAVDIPSGLFADQALKSQKGEVIQADYTLTFQWPKLAFLLPENDVFVGRWEVLPIGLHPDFIRQTETNHHLVEPEQVRSILRNRPKFSHKGTYGHALLIAGSENKSGAAILAAKACMRAGAGLLHVHLPGASVVSMQTAFPEAMISRDESEVCFSHLPELAAYQAVGVGPGLGMEASTASALKLLIQECKVPMVFDADALNLLAENKTWLAFLPPNTILTPHPKEFERMTSAYANGFERLELQRKLAMRHKIIVVVKGAHTTICLPDGKCYFNSTGNPGMATAGSGDVLTGMILGLLAQGYSPAKAALLGVYLHGLAGDLAAEKTGMESLISSDIIAHLGHAFNYLRSGTK